jgi:hypothetical protein
VFTPRAALAQGWQANTEGLAGFFIVMVRT